MKAPMWHFKKIMTLFTAEHAECAERKQRIIKYIIHEAVDEEIMEVRFTIHKKPLC